MSDVYISYSREETQRAKQLANALAQSGFSVWWDRQILVGASWANQIERQLDQASCVVVLWSATSIKSDWVLDEAAYARESNKLIPVMLDDITLPLGFRALQSVELSNWNGELAHPGFQRLVHGISKLVKS
jgi:hypothetical protein